MERFFRSDVETERAPARPMAAGQLCQSRPPRPATTAVLPGQPDGKDPQHAQPNRVAHACGQTVADPPAGRRARFLALDSEKRSMRTNLGAGWAILYTHGSAPQTGNVCCDGSECYSRDAESRSERLDPFSNIGKGRSKDVQLLLLTD